MAAATREALRSAAARLVPFPDDTTVGQVLDLARAKNAMPLVLALGVDDPRVARTMGHELSSGGRRDVHALRDTRLIEAARVLAEKFPPLSRATARSSPSTAARDGARRHDGSGRGDTKKPGLGRPRKSRGD